VTYLKILSLLLSSATTTRVLGPQGLQLSVEITQYLLNRGLYPLLSKAITAIVSLPFIIQTGSIVTGHIPPSIRYRSVRRSNAGIYVKGLI